MISGNLEYLMSSLPHLTFRNSEEEQNRISSTFRRYAGKTGEEKPLVEILEDEAKKFLRTKDFLLFHQIQLNTIHQPNFQVSKNKIIFDFAQFNLALKDALRQLRISRKQGKGEPVYLKNLHLPWSNGTPLEEEKQIMKFQWDKLEALSIGHFADFGSLVIYKLKLMILLRWWSFDMEKGFDVFTKLTKRN